MVEKTTQLLPTSIDQFFVRSGLNLKDKFDCFQFAESLFPGEVVLSAPCQGYCSLTLFVGENLVLQFRPECYKLDIPTICSAREVFGAFAPQTKSVAILPNGLLVYSMNRLKGVSFTEFRANNTMAGSKEILASLCRDFAIFLSKSWHRSSGCRNLPLGLVGRSIMSRLVTLSTDLPPRFRPTARYLLQNIDYIKALPWTMTHGDIAPSNLVVNPSTGRLVGFVDFAEAETLPFGVCLYGLEEILGEMTATGFRYSRDAEYLRRVFWAELADQIPDLRQRAKLDAVLLARDLGVLLWHGIAFDDGAIDRVVQEGKDLDGIRRLDAFLDIEKPCFETSRI